MITLTAVAAAAASALLAFSRPVEMRVDGQPLISDVAPVTATGDRAYVPVRALATALGADTYSDQKTGEVTVIRGKQSVRLKVGDTRVTTNGMPITLKHAPFRVRGRIMIGLKAFARAFGVRVSYDKHASRIDIHTDGVIEANNDITE